MTCPHGMLKCNDSTCISAKLICDGEKNCHDATDEQDCTCTIDSNVTNALVQTDPMIRQKNRWNGGQGSELLVETVRIASINKKIDQIAQALTLPQDAEV